MSQLLTPRPAPGNVGQRFQAVTNSFSVSSLPKQIFYHYDGEWTYDVLHCVYAETDRMTQSVSPFVDVSRTNYACSSSTVITPEVKTAQRKAEIVERLQTTHATVFKTQGAFDGGRAMFSPLKFELQDNKGVVSRSFLSVSNHVFTRTLVHGRHGQN